MTEQQCGAVLLRMVEMLGAPAPMKFGDALKCAAIEVGVLAVPPDVEQMLLRTAFQIIATGRIPGCPDA